MYRRHDQVLDDQHFVLRVQVEQQRSGPSRRGYDRPISLCQRGQVRSRGQTLVVAHDCVWAKPTRERFGGRVGRGVFKAQGAGRGPDAAEWDQDGRYRQDRRGSVQEPQLATPRLAGQHRDKDRHPVHRQSPLVVA